MLNKFYKPLLIIIFVIALTLRWWYLPQKAISFAYDQARDAFLIQEMAHGDLKVLGPPVSGVPGLFHGVLYYYVIAPIYVLGNGDPVLVAYFLSFVSSLGVFAVYYLALLLTKNKIPAIFSALIFAFSFEASQYANLMTNASMGMWFVPIFYIGLYLWIGGSVKLKKQRYINIAPVITGFGLGLAIQSEVALAYHIFPLVIWLIICRKKINIKDLITFMLSLFVAVSTMILAEVKFGFTATSGVIYLLTGKDGIVQSKNIFDYFTTLFNQSGKTFAYSLFPQKIIVGSLLGFFMIISSLFLNRKEIRKNILTWETLLISCIFAYAFALPFGGWNMRHILVGVAPEVSVFAGIFIWKYFNKFKILSVSIMMVVLIANTLMILKENRYGQTIFPLQLDLTLEKEISAVDFTYQKSDGQPFSISSITSPLYVNTLWSYIYNWYGKEKYGYVPYWVGRDQINQLGNNLQFAPGNIKKHFFIIEPTYGIPDLYIGYAKGDQEAMSSLIGQKNFGEIIVQERTRKNEK